jgi:hypothetical protein
LAFHPLRHIGDQAPRAKLFAEITAVRAIDLSPMEAPDMPPVIGPEIVTVPIAEGTAPVV